MSLKMECNSKWNVTQNGIATTEGPCNVLYSVPEALQSSTILLSYLVHAPSCPQVWKGPWPDVTRNLSAASTSASKGAVTQECVTCVGPQFQRSATAVLRPESYCVRPALARLACSSAGGCVADCRTVGCTPALPHATLGPARPALSLSHRSLTVPVGQ